MDVLVELEDQRGARLGIAARSSADHCGPCVRLRAQIDAARPVIIRRGMTEHPAMLLDKAQFPYSSYRRSLDPIGSAKRDAFAEAGSRDRGRRFFGLTPLRT